MNGRKVKDKQLKAERLVCFGQIKKVYLYAPNSIKSYCYQIIFLIQIAVPYLVARHMQSLGTEFIQIQYFLHGSYSKILANTRSDESKISSVL